MKIQRISMEKYFYEVNSAYAVIMAGLSESRNEAENIGFCIDFLEQEAQKIEKLPLTEAEKERYYEMLVYNIENFPFSQRELDREISTKALNEWLKK